MSSITIDDQTLKVLLKEALVEVLQERPGLLRDVLAEAVEDIGLALAIKGGREHDRRQQGCGLEGTGVDRRVAVGRHREQLVMIPYEENQGTIIPVTIHATTRRQIKYRIKVGRFINE